MKEVFKLDDTNDILKKIYETKEHYKITDYCNESDICFIFFSGNGIYYPNTKETFYEVICKRNRFEWENIASSEEIKSMAGRIIYVRDIYKQYYVKGISKEINSIDKLCSKLEQLTQGYQVITCGNSSGGYMAAIVGHYLHAKRVFDFGGQWDLTTIIDLDRCFYLKRYWNDTDRKKYFFLPKYMENNSVPVFYFYSALNSSDIQQVSTGYEKIPNTYTFSMKSKSHGFLLLGGCYAKLLCMNENTLFALNKKYQKSKMISLRCMAFELLDLKSAVKVCWKDIVRCHKLLQKINELYHSRKNRE